MRFSVDFKVRKLDIAYRMKVYSLIKQAIRSVDEPYYGKLFIERKERIKPFTYSTFLHNFSIEGSIIQLEKITITVSSADMEFFVHAFNGMRKMKEYKAGNDVWIQSNIQLLKEHTITNRKALFSTLSPILVEDKTGKALSPVDSNYVEELNYFANNQIQEFAGRKLKDELRFYPVRMRKSVVKERNRYLKSNDYLYFTAYGGQFYLEGDPDDLQLLYQLGLGKRSTYFGMINYIGEGV